ncbi:glycine-rich RNA-binding mitochondrial-like isoform X2, partial [Brachionus plicatilis]
MSNSSSDTLLFVQGIPIDLDRKGLANLFTRAGPVKNARLIPPKNSSYTSTFGFVEFSSRTTAATALEMFNNYKLGAKYLNVSYAQQKNSQDNALSRNSVCSNGRAVSRMSNHDLNQSSDSDKLSRKSSIGRGSIIHQNQPQRYQRGSYDLSRPFARKALTRQNSNRTSSKEAFVDAAEQPKALAKSLEELTIGELYPVYITHVNTPSNFFVHLITAKEKTANLINNMDNYYRNGLHQENADLE